jgi:hypothetical protein
MIPRIPPLSLLAALVLAVLAPGVAPAQLATMPPRISPPEELQFDGKGTYDVWQGDVHLGTEEYERYRSVTGDSTIAYSLIHYHISSSDGIKEFEKKALLISGTLDRRPYFYQTTETVDGVSWAMKVVFADTSAQIYVEKEGKGTSTVIVIPLEKLFVFDPGIYYQIEIMVGEFVRRRIESRRHKALVPRTERILDLKLVRRGEEDIQLASGEEKAAVKVDLSDDLTVFEVWLDEDGRLLRMESKAQGIRVARQEDEATPTSDS